MVTSCGRWLILIGEALIFSPLSCCLTSFPSHPHLHFLRRCNAGFYPRFFLPDLFLLQYCAAQLPPHLFLESVLSRFGLLAWFARAAATARSSSPTGLLQFGKEAEIEERDRVLKREMLIFL